jgi:hypothetical protein
MRDEFDAKTKEILPRRVGFRCSNPQCRQLTSGPQADPAKAINIGVAAHISAASPGGPRYEPEMPPEKRRSIENGIWLCQNCAKLVDNDEKRYPCNLLKDWKNQSEADSLAEIEGKRPAQVSPREINTIGINPGSIPLGADRGGFGEFTISNRTNDPYWQVWIKVTSDPPLIDLQDLEIDILERSPQGSREQRAGDLSINVHVVTDDDEGRQVRFLMIQRMRPADYLTYFIRVPANQVQQDILELHVELFSIGSEPLRMIMKDGKPAVHISFPVPLKGKSSVWMSSHYPVVDS